MRRISETRSLGSLLFIGLIIGLGAAMVGPAGAQVKPGLAIVPFLVEKIEDPAGGAVCPICKAPYRSGRIEPGAQKVLTRVLDQKMEAAGSFRIVPRERVEEVLSNIDKKELQEKALALAPTLGKEVGAEFVILGYLFRFEERVGSSMGVEKPASVGFDLHLVRVKDGGIVWSARFDETQKPLSDNVLKIGSFFRRGASWVKAEELADVGMGEALKNLPAPEGLEVKK
jgi:hypothetical protein